MGRSGPRAGHINNDKGGEGADGPGRLDQRGGGCPGASPLQLPALIALRRLAGTVHSAVNGAQWREVCEHLTAKQGSALEALLKVDSQTQESLFAQLCRAPGRASRKNLKALIERHQWLQELPDPTAALQTIADSKVLQWANEAKRLKAGELREYIRPRRHALLLAVIRQARR